MPITVRSQKDARFERRWLDYCEVLQAGTPSSVGRLHPKPPDQRESVERLLRVGKIASADKALDDVWDRDAGYWQKRLKVPFLGALTLQASRAFGRLVTKGCQPDLFAQRFWEAAQTKRMSDAQRHITRELDELDKCAEHALGALSALTSRRKQFDDYLWENRFRVPEDEPPTAELVTLMDDFRDFVKRQRVDTSSLRRQIDGRRQPLTGHAQVRLSIMVQVVTGSFNDKDVECVLNELLFENGDAELAEGTLKRKRARWISEKAGGGKQSRHSD